MATVAATETRFARIRRGLGDPARAAEFYAWLLGLAAEETSNGFCLRCANGEFIIHSSTARPVALELSASNTAFGGHDPDGVPITVSEYGAHGGDRGPKLDHVSMNCANLAETIGFYRRLGFVLTWSGVPPDYIDTRSGFQSEPLPRADWVHVSCADGYLALSQADWRDYGRHTANSGPPRFVHVGFEVRDLDVIAGRLGAAGIPYLRAQDSLGERLYLNDPNGDVDLGSNVELIQYVPGAPRSGRPPY